MNETINMNETVEAVDTVEQENVKPYKFRKLSADDMFLMFSILKGIGLKELKQSFDKEQLKELMKVYQESAPDKGNDKALIALGIDVALNAADVLLGNLPKCKEHLYQLLASVSGVPEDTIRADALLFTEMVIDFVKKEEFPAFIKVVSKLFR